MYLSLYISAHEVFAFLDIRSEHEEEEKEEEDHLRPRRRSQ